MKAQLLAILAIGLLVGIVATQGDDQKEAKAVLDKAIKAMGGQAQLAKLTNVSMKGRITEAGDNQQISINFDALGQGLNRYHIELDMQEGGKQSQAILVLDGNKGWVKEGEKTKDAPEGMAAFFQDLFHAGRMPQILPKLTDKAYKLSHLGEVKVGTRPAVGLFISHKDRKDVGLFFDKENGLPLKTEIHLTEPFGEKKELTIELRYGDYKDFDGILFCSKVTILADGKEFTMALTEVKGLEKVDDSQFGRP